MVLRHPKYGVLLVPDSAKPEGSHWSITAELTPMGEVVARARRLSRARATWVATGRTEERLVRVNQKRWSYLQDAFTDSGTTEVARLHHEYECVVSGAWVSIYTSEALGLTFEGSAWVTDPLHLNSTVLREEVVELPFAHVSHMPGFHGFDDACLEVVLATGWEDAL